MVELRAVSRADAESIFAAWGCYPENFIHLTARVFTSCGDAERYIETLFPTPESRAFHIVTPAGEVIGIVKAAVLEHRAQIGYIVHRPHAGRGFASAAVLKMVSLLEGLPQISRIWATCALENHASARVLEKCGFEREAILRNWVVYPALGCQSFDNYSYVRIPQRAVSK